MTLPVPRPSGGSAAATAPLLDTSSRFASAVWGGGLTLSARDLGVEAVVVHPGDLTIGTLDGLLVVRREDAVIRAGVRWND